MTPDRLLGSPTPAPLPGGRGEGDCFALRAKATVPHSGRTTGGGGQRGGAQGRRVRKWWSSKARGRASVKPWQANSTSPTACTSPPGPRPTTFDREWGETQINREDTISEVHFVGYEGGDKNPG